MVAGHLNEEEYKSDTKVIFLGINKIKWDVIWVHLVKIVAERE